MLQKITGSEHGAGFLIMFTSLNRNNLSYPQKILMRILTLMNKCVIIGIE